MSSSINVVDKPRYSNVKISEENSFCSYILIGLSYLLLVVLFPFAIFKCIKVT